MSFSFPENSCSDRSISLAIDVTSAGTPEEKLKWIFNAFDKGSNRSGLRVVLTSKKGGHRTRDPPIPLIIAINPSPSDGGGTIDDDEVYGVVVALFKMLNRETEDEKVDDIVDDILEKVDANGDGVISQQEFVHHAMKSSFLAELIENHTNTKPSK